MATSKRTSKPTKRSKGSPRARRESIEDRRARAATVFRELRSAYPDARCSLNYRTPLELLIATILSAQCTDDRVNQVTPGLFRRYPSASDIASAPRADLETAIRSTGFYRNKAKSIQGACARIVDHYGGAVPRSMEDLLTLPGVARKTANVVLGNAFGMAAGVVVDTHVHRVATRLGLTREKTPEKIERDLMAILPAEEWIVASHRLILHGRRVCQARKPRCAICPVNRWCPSAEEPPARGSFSSTTTPRPRPPIG